MKNGWGLRGEEQAAMHVAAVNDRLNHAGCELLLCHVRCIAYALPRAAHHWHQSAVGGGQPYQGAVVLSVLPKTPDTIVTTRGVHRSQDRGRDVPLLSSHIVGHDLVVVHCGTAPSSLCVSSACPRDINNVLPAAVSHVSATTLSSLIAPPLPACLPKQC
jgi:hypothetical protein